MKERTNNMKLLVDIKDLTKEEYLKVQEYIYNFCKQECLIVDTVIQYQFLFQCALMRKKFDECILEYNKEKRKLNG